VPTGLTTNVIILESLPPDALPCGARPVGNCTGENRRNAWAADIPKLVYSA
jgi:hypothetical protein